jgi:hypothetical protein
MDKKKLPDLRTKQVKFNSSRVISNQRWGLRIYEKLTFIPSNTTTWSQLREREGELWEQKGQLDNEKKGGSKREGRNST